MKLKLFSEQTNQSWTLKPNRDYIIGSGNECDINIEQPNLVSEKHLKISFNSTINSWYLYDLASTTGTYVNQQRVNDYPINSQTRIGLGNNYFLTAAPELAPVTPSYSPPPQPININKHNGYSNGLNGGTTAYKQPALSINSSSLEVLSWKKYVRQQVAKQSTPLGRFRTWYQMITGFRKTPWLRAYGSDHDSFEAFDGYIIPDYRSSVEQVISAIQNKVGNLRQYQNTDCFVSKLTDAHIVNSTTQLNSGVELFPIKRGVGEEEILDYRDFIVTSYNRVKNYLLIEQYGTDLFVSWITRFEPESSLQIMSLTLFIIIVFYLICAAMNAPNAGFGFFILIALWLQVYLLTPFVMEYLKILPKKANTWLVMSIVSFPNNLVLLAAWLIFQRLPSMLTKEQPFDVPPFDLIDAKKLDDMVSKQVEEALKPILQSEGRNQEQIEKILTRTSLGGGSFKR